MYGAVKLQDLPASRHLVKSVNILRDHSLKLPLPLQMRQGLMGRIGPGIRKQHPVFIETGKIPRDT